jgi:hypothetical protein
MDSTSVLLGITLATTIVVAIIHGLNAALHD